MQVLDQIMKMVGIDTFIIDEVLDYIPAIDLQKKAAYLYGEEPTQENLINFENIEILSSSDFVLIGDGNTNILKGGSGDDILKVELAPIYSSVVMVQIAIFTRRVTVGM